MKTALQKAKIVVTALLALIALPVQAQAAGTFLGTDGKYHPKGSVLGEDGKYHSKTEFLAEDGKYRQPGSFLGEDGKYHPPGSFLGPDNKYHTPRFRCARRQALSHPSDARRPAQASGLVDPAQTASNSAIEVRVI